MNARAQTPLDRIADKARHRYEDIVETARHTTEAAAGRVAMGKRPVQKLSDMGLKLSAVSHRTADRVLKQQTRLVEHQIDAMAGRLAAAADAQGVRDLIRTQVRLIPANAAQFARDTRDTLSIVVDAGSEVRDVVAGAFSELRSARTSPRPPASKPATRKAATRKKTARKPAAKRKTAKKKAAAKTAAAKRPVTKKPATTPATRKPTPPASSPSTGSSSTTA